MNNTAYIPTDLYRLRQRLADARARLKREEIEIAYILESIEGVKREQYRRELESATE